MENPQNQQNPKQPLPTSPTPTTTPQRFVTAEVGAALATRIEEVALAGRRTFALLALLLIFQVAALFAGAGFLVARLVR